MPLFTPATAKGEEAAALYTCRSLISQCSTMQELCEVASSAAALAKISPGLPDPPADVQGFTIDELEQRLVLTMLYPHFEEGGLIVAMSKGVGCVSEKEGFFKWHIRRQIRDVEYNAPNGRWDVYMYFLDRTGHICQQLVELADLNLMISQIKRTAGPVFSHVDDQPTQGRYIWADFLIRWGGSENME
jgi:hypothetical protein